MPDNSVMPAPNKWALVIGSWFVTNRCPCPGGCKFVLRGRPNWGGWSTAKGVASEKTSGGTEDFEVSISCVGGVYTASVSNDSDCVRTPLYGSLNGNCDECYGTVGWTQDGCDCCGCEPGEATSMAATISEGEPSVFVVDLPPIPDCNPMDASTCCAFDSPGVDPDTSGTACCEDPACCDECGSGSCPARHGGGGTCNGGTCAVSAYPIRYATGEILMRVTDIESSGLGFPLAHTRSFASRLTLPDNRGNGYNWLVKQWPELVRTPISGKSGSYIAVVNDAVTPVWFKDNGNDTFDSTFGSKNSLVLDRAGKTFTLTSLDGSEIIFDSVTGRAKSMTTGTGHTITITEGAANDTKVSTIEQSATVDGVLVTERLQYTWSQPYDMRLTSVTLQRKEGTGSWADIRRASYTYYGLFDDFGASEDLQTVKTENWNGTSWTGTGTTYYRYYKTPIGETGGGSGTGSSSSGTPTPPPESEYTHLLKYVVKPDAYKRLSDDPNVSDPLTASDAIVAQYADHYFEFDDEQRVTKEIVEGGSLTFAYAYATSSFSDGPNSWK